MAAKQSDNRSRGVTSRKPFARPAGAVIKITGILFIRFPKQHIYWTKVRILKCLSNGTCAPIETTAPIDDRAVHEVTGKFDAAPPPGGSIGRVNRAHVHVPHSS